VVVGGVEYPVDCLIFATGFEVGVAYNRRSQLQIVGHGGERLSDKWADGPRTFWGMQSHGFPNCFFIDFIQSAFVGCVTHSLDEQATHVAWLVRATRERGAHVIDVSRQAEDDWVAEVQRTFGARMAFYKECTPGYYNDEGKPDQSPWGFQRRAYGGGSRRYFAMLKEWREQGELVGEELHRFPA
jgi:cyclohexanone monooxygenase